MTNDLAARIVDVKQTVEKAIEDSEKECGCWHQRRVYALMRRMAARIEELEKALEWQPIETAPKDETAILVATEEGISLVAWRPEDYLYEGDWAVYADGMIRSGEDGPVWLINTPTHWRPLPSRPGTDARAVNKT